MEKIEKLIAKYKERANTLQAIPAEEIIKDLENLKDPWMPYADYKKEEAWLNQKTSELIQQKTGWLK